MGGRPVICSGCATTKSLAAVSGVIQQLDPEFNLLELIQPKLRKLLAERASPRRLLRQAGMS